MSLVNPVNLQLLMDTVQTTKGDDDSDQGQLDHSRDNGTHRGLFFEVEGQKQEQEDALVFSTSENCSQSIEDLKGVIKRADAVSPQVADVVEKVMSQGLLAQQQDWKNKNYESSFKNHQSSDVEANIKETQNKTEEYISHYNKTVENNDKHLSEEDWHRWQQEKSLNHNQERYSENLYDKDKYNHSNYQKDLEKNDKQFENAPEEEWHKKYDNSHLNSSFQDEDSNTSVPSPYGSQDNHSNYISDGNSSYDADRIPLIPNKEGVFFCHLCSFSGTSQVDFESHMTCHFEHACPHCDYKSRTEGRLKRHIKDFHTDDSQEGFGAKRNMGRPKVFRCKQCDFVATEKEEFWAHSRSHIKDDKILQCPRCPFVTEYKHHLEYHLRNHFGSKPFKCNKCNYSCVNKSMLNSHMKSHTNVYQYRCADCTYATKYCHSLKLHLRKYNHKPATVLNSDGSLPQGIDAESSGLSLMQKRGPPRGPRGPRKEKFDPFVGHLLSMPHPGMPGMPPSMNSGMMSPYWPILSQFPNGLQGPPPLVPLSMNGPHPPDVSPQGRTGLGSNPALHRREGMHGADTPYKCNFCSFSSTVKHELLRHVMKVHAAENQDLFSIFGISSEALLDDQATRLPFLGHKFLQKQGSNLKQTQKLLESKCERAAKAQTSLRVKTEPEMEIKDSPHSWPHESTEEVTPAKIDSSGRYSMPELGQYQSESTKSSDPPADGDIIKQMMYKFGSGIPSQIGKPKDTAPLDLTKRRSASSSPFGEHDNDDLENTNYENPNDGNISSGGDGESLVSGETSSQSPRKRSRKGKAFKLDTLCMKLQEKRSDSTYDSGDEEYSETEDPREEEDTKEDEEVGNRDTSGTEDKTNSRKEEADDDILKQIHNNLAILDQDEHAPEAKRPRLDFPRQGNRTPGTEMVTSSLMEEEVENKKEEVTSSKFSRTENTNGVNTIHYANGNKHAHDDIQKRREMEFTWKMLNNLGMQGGQQSFMSQNPFQNGFPLPMMMGENSPIKRHNIPGHHLPPFTSTPKGKNGIPVGKDKYECVYCEIAFRDCVMYTMHMGYHGYRDPFKCNMCGHTSKDKVEFFLHIARAAHN